MLKRILYTLLSVLLLSLPWLGGSALTLFVAFVPLLWVEHSLAGQTGRRGKPRRFWPYVVSAFVLWWLATVWWVGYAAVIGVVAATVVGATQMSVVFLVYHAVLRRARRALACTVLVSGWIAYETLFINGEISFPWLVLGNAFAQDVRLVQWYEWTGALGGSLWVLVTNLLVFEAIRRPRGWRGWAAPALAFVVPAAVSLTMYATYREPERTVRVTVVQPNIDPYYEKFVLKQAEQRGILLSLMAQAPEDVDFIVAPETAIDEDFWEKSIGRAPAIVQFRDFVRERYPSALVVTGAVLTLILMLTMGGRHEAKRAVTLPVVYWSGPPPEAPDETPPEEVPVTAETVPEVSAPPKPVTLAFESPAIAAAGLPMPKYEIGRPTVDRVMTVPDFSFESPAAPAAAAPSAPAVSSIALARPVHRVPPQYPVKAKQQGIEGYVVMDLRINAEGRVEDVRVVREKPEGVFRASALRVVRRWAFMPPAEPAWQRLTIRYELEK